MKKLFIAALLLSASASFAQFSATVSSSGGSGTFTGGTVSGATTFQNTAGFSGATNPGLSVNALTTTQRDALAAPADGTIIWNTSSSVFNFRASGTWVQFCRLTGCTFSGAVVLTTGSTAPTPTAGTNDTTIATTAFVAASFAPLASPPLTGTPTAPTAAGGTNTTQLATTAFVAASFAPLASPALTGTPSAPTAAGGTNTTQLATTAFVAASFAPLVSPSLTTPSLGVATATTINKVTLTAPATAATLTIANNKTLTANNSLTLAGTDTTTMTFPSASDTIAGLAATNAFTGSNTFTEGTATAVYPPSGFLNVNSTTAGTAADLAEATLWSYTLPANALSANNKGVRVTVHWHTGADANTKIYKMYFGATTVHSYSSAGNNIAYVATMTVIRTGASAEIADNTILEQGVSPRTSRASPTDATNATILIKFTGTNGTAVLNDVVFDFATVEAIQ